MVFETEHLIRNWFGGRGYVYRIFDTDYRPFHGTLPYDFVYAVVYGLTGGSPAANLVVQWLFAALLCWVVCGTSGCGWAGRWSPGSAPG
jgi:hypothetical protein